MPLLSREVRLTLPLVLLSSTSILAGSLRNGSIVRDVGPEAGLVWSEGTQPFVFRGNQEILVSASRAGIHKSFNRGDLWLRTEPGLVDAMGVEPYPQTLCQSPSNPNIVYLATLANGMFRTSDFGESWERLASLSNPYLLSCVVDSVDPDVVYALAGIGDNPQFPGILFKSIDGGQSFLRVGTNLPTIQFANSIAVAPTNPQSVYLADSSDDYSADGALYLSSDGGLHFRALPNAPPPLAVYPHPTEDGTLLLLAAVGGHFGLFSSTDGGETFAQIGTGLPEFPISLAFDPIDASTMYVAAGVSGLFRSVDNGLTFQRLKGLGELRGLGANQVGVTRGSDPTQVVLYVGTPQGAFRSDDNGETFQAIHSGYRGTQVNGLALDASGRFLVTTINTVGGFRSIGPGVYELITDTLPSETLFGLFAIGAAPDDANLYLVAASTGRPSDGLYRSVNGGVSWTLVVSDSFFGRNVIAFAASDPNRVYVSSDTALYASSDRGASFVRRAPVSIGPLAVDPSDANVLYVGAYSGGSGIYKSTDGGATFAPTGQRGNFYDLAVDSKNPQVVYAGERFGSVLRSLDGGATFTRADRGLSGDRVLGLAADPAHPSRVFVWMHAGGLFRSDDQAEQWTPVDGTGETLRRGTAQAGYTNLAIDSRDPEHVFLGNGSVLQVDIAP